MRILVTGANGFVGAEIVRHLIAEGHEVVGAVRNVEDLQRRLPGVQPVRADFAEMREADDWQPLLDGVDAVVNCVGVLEEGGRDSLNAAHVDGAGALFAACAAYGPRRVVHISAIGAENDAGTGYGRSKAEGDEKLMAADLDWVILRPSLVIGRNVYGGTALMRGLAGFPGIALSANMPGEFRPVTIDDVAACVARFVAPEAPSRLALDIAGPDTMTLGDLVKTYRNWLGLRPGLRLPVPGGLVTVLAALGDVAHFLGWRTALCTTALKQMAHNVGGDPERWQQKTGIAAESLDAFLTRNPATVQDRWHAGLYLLKPVVIVAVSAFLLFAGLAYIFTTLGFYRFTPIYDYVTFQIGILYLVTPAFVLPGFLLLLQRWHRLALLLLIGIQCVAVILGLVSAVLFRSDSAYDEIEEVPIEFSIADGLSALSQIGFSLGVISVALLLLVLDRSR